MNEFHKHRASGVLACYSNAGEIIEKATPVGFINKYGKQKQPDGTWKYVGHGQHTPSQEEAVQHHSAEDLKFKEEEQKLDINQRFEAYARYTKAVIQGKFKSCIAYGTGGVGKTYTALKQLEIAGKVGFDEELHQPVVAAEGEEDEDGGTLTSDYDYVKITGKATPTAVYAALYEHNGKILVFDDCDSVLKNEDAINIFKGALDTSGDGTITYASASKIFTSTGALVPKRFKFSGRALFISNLSSTEMPQPLKSRSLRVDLTMDKIQTMERLRKIATNPHTGQYTNLHFPNVHYTHDDLAGILDFIDKYKNVLSDLNVRTVGAFLAIKQIADIDNVNWEEELKHMVFSKGEDVEILHSGDDNSVIQAALVKLHEGESLKEVYEFVYEAQGEITDITGIPAEN